MNPTCHARHKLKENLSNLPTAHPQYSALFELEVILHIQNY